MRFDLAAAICPDAGPLAVANGEARLPVVVSVPVEYQPREFVLYLFGVVCCAVVGDDARKLRPAWTKRRRGRPHDRPTTPEVTNRLRQVRGHGNTVGVRYIARQLYRLLETDPRFDAT